MLLCGIRRRSDSALPGALLAAERAALPALCLPVWEQAGDGGNWPRARPRQSPPMHIQGVPAAWRMHLAPLRGAACHGQAVRERGREAATHVGRHAPDVPRAPLAQRDRHERGQAHRLAASGLPPLVQSGLGATRVVSPTVRAVDRSATQPHRPRCRMFLRGDGTVLGAGVRRDREQSHRCHTTQKAVRVKLKVNFIRCSVYSTALK
jgi:hypothetical protein